MHECMVYIFADPSACGFLNSIRFDSKSEVKRNEGEAERNPKRSESEVKPSESENEAKSKASRCEAIDKPREIWRVPGGPGARAPPHEATVPPWDLPTTNVFQCPPRIPHGSPQDLQGSPGTPREPPGTPRDPPGTSQ